MMTGDTANGASAFAGRRDRAGRTAGRIVEVSGMPAQEEGCQVGELVADGAGSVKYSPGSAAP